jgi:hypothetical protein
MKSTSRITLLVLIASLTLTTATSARASFLSGSSQIDWSAFSMTPANGMTVTWVDRADKTTAFVTLNGITTEDFDQSFHWNSVGSSASQSIPGGNASGTALTSAAGISADYGAAWSTATSTENAAAGRNGTFKVSGSGNIVFSVPYSLEYEMNLDPSHWGRTSSYAGLAAINYTSATQLVDSVWMGDEATGAYASQDSDSGILSVQLYFDDGDTGAVGVGVGGVPAEWWPPAAPVNAVPEPETYAMLFAGLGLLGWAARRRKLQALY